MKKKRCAGKWTAVRKSRQRSAVDSHYRAGKTERPGSIHRKYFSLTSAQDGMPLRGMMVIPAHPRASYRSHTACVSIRKGICHLCVIWRTEDISV